MPDEPTDEELIAFAESTLADLAESLRERDVLQQTIAEHSELWRTLYRISRAMGEESPPT